MNSIFVLNVGDAKKQLGYERSIREKLIAHYVVKFLSNNQITTKQVEDCVKKKKPKLIVFDSVPEQVVRTIIHHLRKKFPSLQYYSTTSISIEGLTIIPSVKAVLEYTLTPAA